MVIICHYGEIALKGKNRSLFEKKLVDNIKLALQAADLEYDSIQRISGRILLKLKSGQGRIEKTLSNIFGLVHFSFAQECGQDLKSIQKNALKIFEKTLKEKALKGKTPAEKTKNSRSFKVFSKRSEKTFPLTSQEINERVGEYILNKFKNQKPKIKIKVDLNKPDITIFVEIVEKYAFVYTEKIPGPGGLPVGISGRAVSLLSGGIDSPVASYLAMKRGLKLAYIHFHALPFTSKASVEKVEKLTEILKKFQPQARLFLVPFAGIQKQIALNCPAKLRVVLYRRMMFRIAKQLAEKEKAKALVTGENLGQVASQTLENISAIAQAINLPVLRPLLGFDKQEIIRRAEKIGTYKISALPHQDCCSRFVPRHPETKARLAEIEQAEKKLETKKLVEQALKNSVLKQ